MKAANARMRSAAGRGKLLALVALTASIAAFGGDVALAQNAECARLQQAIAARRGSSGAQAAVERQRADSGEQSLRRLARLRQPQVSVFRLCAASAMRRGQRPNLAVDLADLQARAGGGAGDLVARYNAECLHAAPSGPSNVFEALFGGIARLANGGPDSGPQMDDRFDDHGGELRNAPPGQSDENGGVHAHAGSYAVCVRTCDGSFFPVSYSGAEAGRTAWRTSAGPCAPTRTWPSTRFRSAERSKRPRRRRGSPTRICPTPANSREPRSELLLPAQGGELGGSAQPAPNALWPREARHSGDAGEVGGDGPADHRPPRLSQLRTQKADHKAYNASVVAGPGAAPGATPSSNAATAVPGRQWRRHEAQRGSRHGQPRDVGHCRRRRAGGEELHRDQGQKWNGFGPRRRQTLGADSRASALARPMSGRSAASSGPASRPVKARRNG